MVVAHGGRSDIDQRFITRKDILEGEILMAFNNFRLGNCIALGKKNRKIKGLSHFFT